MPARGRPREFDPDAALEAALMLFWRHGYEGTSLAALSEATGVNMPSLYAAFGNKESLFRKAADRYMQRQASYLPNAMKEPKVRDAVRALFNGAIDLAMHSDRPDGCLLVQGALVTGPIADGIRDEMATKRGLAERCIRARFERAIAEGELAADTDPAALAGYVMTLIWGLSVQAAGGAKRPQLEAIAEQVLSMFPAAPKKPARRTARA